MARPQQAKGPRAQGLKGHMGPGTRPKGPQIEPKIDQKSPPGGRWGRSGLPAFRPWVHKALLGRCLGRCLGRDPRLESCDLGVVQGCLGRRRWGAIHD